MFRIIIDTTGGYNYTIGALVNGGEKTELHVGGIPVQQVKLYFHFKLINLSLLL